MKVSRLSWLVLIMSVFVSAAAAQDVHTDYDKQATFENYHTYCWGKVQSTNPLWQKRIQQAVDQTLQQKGWHLVPNGGDVTVAAVGATKNQQEYNTFYTGMGGGWRWGGFGTTATTTVDNYKVGTLVVDLYDSASKQLVFRGTASDTLSNNPEKNEKNLDKAVDKMFKKFPPERAK